ncbi:MAG: LemA family protein [Deltaproteobacteria bacterium]|nr:MAG: LemA family protein [Deltaproteobacteria bacterium]
MKRGTAILIGIVALVVVVGLYFVGVRNRLVRLEIRVEEKWAQVENVLQRRADLIPNLVNTVKGYASHEREIFEEVARARSRLLSARTVDETLAANGQLTAALGRLLAIAERYPDLKADRTFTRLMDELAGTENRIALERKRYNEAVKDFNTAVRVFPSNIVAGMMGLREKPYFKVEEGKEKVPTVDFSRPGR